MKTQEVRRRIAALRAQLADTERAIAALEKLQAMRMGKVVELVPHDEVLRSQRICDAWGDAEPMERLVA